MSSGEGIGKAGKVHLNPCTVSEKSEKGLEGVVGKVHLNPTLIHKGRRKNGEGSFANSCTLS
jgi:hypothetical protein